MWAVHNKAHGMYFLFCDGWKVDWHNDQKNYFYSCNNGKCVVQNYLCRSWSQNWYSQSPQSSHTTNGLLPPSSMVTLFKLDAPAACMIFLPTAVDPVNATYGKKWVIYRESGKQISDTQWILIMWIVNTSTTAPSCYVTYSFKEQCFGAVLKIL